MRRPFLWGTRWLAAALVTAWSAVCAADVNVREWVFRGGDAKGRAAHFAQDHRFWGSGRYPKDRAFLGKMYRLSSGKTDFMLWLPGKVDAKTGAWRSAVGMGRPSKANWYQNGFYEVRIGRKSNHEFPTEIVAAKGGADRGTVTAQWRHPKALIRTTFILLDGDDKLLVKTEVTPAGKAVAYTVKLTAYPGSMAGGYRRGLALRDREAMTPKRMIARPPKPNNRGVVKTTLNKDEPWVLFYDKHFDVAANRGEGPCAAVYSPAEARATAIVENYSCRLILSYPAKARASHLALWDFHGMTNAAAKDYMRSLVVEHERGK